jgi:hypothetical protein
MILIRPIRWCTQLYGMLYFRYYWRVATVLAAGLTVLPSTVQEAQANPCAEEKETEDDGEEEGNPEFDSEKGFWRY